MNGKTKVFPIITNVVICDFTALFNARKKVFSVLFLTADQQEVPLLYIGGGMNCEKDPQMSHVKVYNRTHKKYTRLLIEILVYGIIQS